MNLKSMSLEELAALSASKHAELAELQRQLMLINDRRRVLEAKLVEQRIAAMTPEQNELRKRNSRSIG